MWMLEKIRMIALLMAVMVGGSALTACNTISGVGEDVEAAGDSLSESARENKAY